MQDTVYKEELFIHADSTAEQLLFNIFASF